MPREHQVIRPARRYERATGPFDGYCLHGRTVPILIYELNLGGAFINFLGEPPEESRLVLQLTLPGEQPMTVQAETVYRHQFGMAVRFVDVDADSLARIARTVNTVIAQNRPHSTRH